MFKRPYLFITLVSLLLLSATVAFAATEEQERAKNAADVLTQVMQIPDKGIPTELMERADAIAVIPHVVKGAFGIGGEYGKGLVSHRGDDGKWSAPAFISIGGGNFGLQLGVQATDVVLVFTNHDGFKGLLAGKVKLGADASVAAGPVGRKAEAGTDVLLKSAVFSYSRSKGLFAGISLDGSVVSMDDSANRKVYGKEINGPDILINSKAKMNADVAPFVRAIEKYSPATPAVKRTND